MDHCDEHSGVIKSLGKLEQGHEDAMNILHRIDGKVEILNKGLANGITVAAIEKVKSSILYWVIAMCATGLFGAAVAVAAAAFMKGR